MLAVRFHKTMIETREIHAVRNCSKARKSWRFSSGKLGTVEEVAREYYLNERGFMGCLIDSACVYGALSWVIFHDILFHDNLNSRQPLCALFFHTPQRFYERHKDVVEQRLKEYQRSREDMFDRQMRQFHTHPFFCDSRSKIAKHSGAWLMRNESVLRDFATMSAEHGQEALIREIMVTSHKGRNAGWPDLVAWSGNSLVFAEVKSTDELSREQRRWIADHEEKYRIELLRVLDGKSNQALHLTAIPLALHSLK